MCNWVQFLKYSNERWTVFARFSIMYYFTHNGMHHYIIHIDNAIKT